MQCWLRIGANSSIGGVRLVAELNSVNVTDPQCAKLRRQHVQGPQPWFWSLIRVET
jgi:hypothetical protein